MTGNHLAARLPAQWAGRFATALARREDEDLPAETERDFLAECSALGVSAEEAHTLLSAAWEHGQQRIDLEHLDVWSDGAWGADDPFAERDAPVRLLHVNGRRRKSRVQPELTVEHHYTRSVWSLPRAA
jgi:hypothetical protein